LSRKTSKKAEKEETGLPGERNMQVKVIEIKGKNTQV
jgi:hypothetical protein